MSTTTVPEQYHDRLSAVAAHRFEIVNRDNALDRESLEGNNNKPQVNMGYNFVWWTEDGAKQIDKGVKFINPASLSFFASSMPDHVKPGQDEWCVVTDDCDEPLLNLGCFWTTAYLWRYEGSCGVSQWDEALSTLENK